MKIILLSFSLIFFLQVNSQDWLFSTHFSGDGNNKSGSLAIDISNNVYIGGNYDGTVLNGVTPWTSYGSWDIHLTKYDNNGTLVWRKRAGGTGNDQASDVAVSQSGDGILMSGIFNADCKFDNDTIFNSALFDGFLVKYNTTGGLLWAKNIAYGAGAQRTDAITVDSNGDIIVAGRFTNSIIIGCNKNPIYNDTITLAGNHVFLAKFDADGNYLEQYSIIQSTSSVIVYDIARIGSSYFFAGSFVGGMSCDLGVYPAQNASLDAYLLKTDTDFNGLWLRKVQGDDFEYGFAVTTDNSNCYVGFYHNNATINIDSTDTELSLTPITNIGDYDYLVMKYDTDGELQWVKTKGSTGRENIYSLDYYNNEVTVAGFFSDQIIVGTDTINTEGAADRDPFFATYDTDGNEVMARSLKGKNLEDNVRSIKYDNDGNILITGDFKADTLFIESTIDPLNIDTLENSVSGVMDMYVAKYGCQNTTLNFALDSVTCTGLSDGKIWVTPSLSDSYSFEWTASASITDTLFNATEGTWHVTVTSFRGCAYIDSVVLESKAPLQISMNKDTATINCLAGTDGTAIATPINGIQAFSYLWTSGETDSTATTLALGMNYVTVTDQCAVPQIDSVFVKSRPVLTGVLSPHTLIITCANGNDGEAQFMSSGGVGTFYYVWTAAVDVTPSASTAFIASDLGIGKHYVQVTDTCGVPVIDSISIYHLPTLSVSPSTTIPATCETNADGVAWFNVSAGIPPYTFVWSASVSDTLIASDLIPGMHYITVTDLCGGREDSIFVTSVTPLTISVTSLAAAACPAINNGEAVVTTANGVSPITFEWGSPSTSVIDTATDLQVGLNYVTVTDFCRTLIGSVDISSLPAMTSSMLTDTAASCAAINDGIAVVGITNGVDPVTFTWSSPSVSTNDTAYDLQVGLVYVTISDVCITLRDSVIIGTKPILQAEFTDSVMASCVGSTNGFAVVTATDGVPPYSYDWNISASAIDTAADLNVGWHFVTVSDVCTSVVNSVFISSMPNLTISSSKTDILCYGDSTGSIVLTRTGGVEPINYLWSYEAATDTFLLDIPSGFYTYSVTDFCGTVTTSISIVQPGALSTTVLGTNVTFSGESDGAIDLISSGGTMPYIYTWSSGQMSEDLANITEGVYYVTLTDNNNCLKTDSITINSDRKYIEVMNVLTPNADGQNDVWIIKYIDAYPLADIKVFNQWGQTVFESKGYVDPWNGKKKNTGKDLPAGTYYYIIALGQGQENYSGSVTILR